MKKIVFLVCMSLLFSMNLSAQGWLEKVGQKAVNTAKQKVENRAAKKAGEATDKTLDKLEKKGNKTTNESTEGTNENTTGDEKKSEKLTATSKYDFVPGDQVILYEDFSQDAVGDFPALWTTDVAGEVNTLNVAPGNWFNLNSGEGTYWYMKDIDFPKNFIVEFDIVPKENNLRIAADLVIFGEDKHSEMDKEGNPGKYGFHIDIEKAYWGTKGYKKGTSEFLTGSSVLSPVVAGEINHVIVWVQGRRLRIYHKGAKVIDVPTNIYEGSKFNRMCFKLYRGASSGSYISNIKITTASPDTRSKLLTEGKLISYGIYFDVNKDVVKAESYGTMKSIADVLKENPDVRIKIVGHTDSDGDNAKNLDLSQRRAKSVMNELVKVFDIAASRIETDGMGETKPVAPNDSPVNKALNRRVEFIKL